MCVWGGGGLPEHFMYVSDSIKVSALGGTTEGLLRRERLVFTKFTHPQSPQYKYSINCKVALEADLSNGSGNL